MRKAHYVLLATAILLGATFLRLADLHRFPPGLHYDEAADMLLSRDIAFYGYRPFPVVTAYSGREALFYYVAAPLVRIFGTDVMATRLTSAFLGILTVAATIALGKAMLRHCGIALLAGAWLAVNGAQVWLTRQGFRTSPQPLLEALALWLLWIGLRRSRRWLIPILLAGAFAGLSLYVYMAARIFPIWLVLPLLILLLADSRRGLRLRQIGTFFAALMVVVLPLAIFYLSNLDVLTDRLEQLAPGTNTPTLWQSTLLHLQLFFLRGDPLLRYNLYPGRPFFDPISGLLLIVGIGAALWLLLRDRLPLARTAGAFVLLSPLLIIPSILAVNGLPPSQMRSVAMVPLIFFLPALGAWTLARLFKLTARSQVLLGAALIIGIGGLTWYDYQRWGGRADLFYDSDGDLNLAAQWLEHNAGADTLIYIASMYYQHPTVLAHPLDSSRIRWMMAEHLFLPPSDREGILIFPRSVPADRWRDVLKPEWKINDLPLGPDGAPAFEAYRVPKRSDDLQPLKVNFADQLRLLGFNAPTAISGGEATITLRWQIEQPPTSADLAPVLELRDQWGARIARVTPYIEYSASWRAGEQLIQRLNVPIPAGNPPGRYQVVAYWAQTASNSYLSSLDEQQRFAGIEAVVGTVEVAAGSSAVPDLSAATEVLSGIYALKTSDLPASIGQGQVLQFEVMWYAQRSLPDAPPLQLLLLDAQDKTTILQQGDPIHGSYPISAWRVGELVIDRYAVRLPADLQAGDYRLLLTADQALHPAFSIPITVTTVDRQFDLPALATTVDLKFGESIRLRGYELAMSGETLSIKLAWQCVQPMNEDYTVFVHIVPPNGSNYSQIDQQPERSTSQCVANEVIETFYTLSVPSDGKYEIRVGLYLQANGARLPITDEAGADHGDALILQPPQK